MTEQLSGWVEKARSLDPAQYDRFRPLYPAALFAAILAYKPVHGGSRCLEIGIGTGQATEPFLQAGASVIALEPETRLGNYTRAKYQGRPHLSVIDLPFENLLPGKPFDLIYAATSFHWITSLTRMQRLRSLLAPTGAIALFWNHPAPLDPVHAALQPVYARFMPAESMQNKAAWSPSDAGAIMHEIREAGFADVQTVIFSAERHLTSHEYVDLLHTYSNHISQPDSIRLPFMRAIADVIDSYGGLITIADSVELHLARRQPLP